MYLIFSFPCDYAMLIMLASIAIMQGKKQYCWQYYLLFFCFYVEKNYLNYIRINSYPILLRIPVKAVLAQMALPVKLGLLLKASDVFVQKDTMERSVTQVHAFSYAFLLHP